MLSRFVHLRRLQAITELQQEEQDRLARQEPLGRINNLLKEKSPEELDQIYELLSKHVPGVTKLALLPRSNY